MSGKAILYKTERLSVRRFAESDLIELYDLLSDPRVMEYLEPPYTYEQSKEFLRKAGLVEPPLVYAVEEKAGRFVGYVIYHSYDANSVELGWVLAPAEWGKGYAVELTGLMLEQAVGKYAYAVIECVPEQTVTKRIALKCGFQYIGTTGGLEVYQREVR